MAGKHSRTVNGVGGEILAVNARCYCPPVAKCFIIFDPIYLPDTLRLNGSIILRKIVDGLHFSYISDDGNYTIKPVLGTSWEAQGLAGGIYTRGPSGGLVFDAYGRDMLFYNTVPSSVLVEQLDAGNGAQRVCSTQNDCTSSILDKPYQEYQLSSTAGVNNVRLIPLLYGSLNKFDLTWVKTSTPWNLKLAVPDSGLPYMIGNDGVRSYTKRHCGQSRRDRLTIIGTYSDVPLTDISTFTMSFDGDTTSLLRWDATAADVQSALESLSTIGAGNIAVGGSVSGSPRTATYDILFGGIFFEQNITDLFTIDSSNMLCATIPSNCSSSVSIIQNGIPREIDFTGAFVLDDGLGNQMLVTPNTAP